MIRPFIRGALALLLAQALSGAGTEGLARADEAPAPTWTTFEEALKGSQSLGAMVEQIGKARGRCDCGDEFEERDCDEEKAAAATWLEQQKYLIDKIEPERVVLGRYDFKRKVFPVAVTSEVSTAKVRQCRLRTNRCPSLSPKPTVIVSSGTKFSWKGEISIPDEGWARALRTGEQQLKGEAILQVTTIKEGWVKDKGAEAARDDARVTLKALEAMPVRERGEEYARVKDCVRHGEVRSRQILVQAQLAQIRLQLGETSFYIVSTLPSRPVPKVTPKPAIKPRAGLPRLGGVRPGAPGAGPVTTTADGGPPAPPALPADGVARPGPGGVLGKPLVPGPRTPGQALYKGLARPGIRPPGGVAPAPTPPPAGDK